MRRGIEVLCEERGAAVRCFFLATRGGGVTISESAGALSLHVAIARYATAAEKGGVPAEVTLGCHFPSTCCESQSTWTANSTTSW